MNILRESYPSTNKLSMHKLTVVLLMITAVLGYVVSYDKLYAFHLVLAIYWVLVFTTITPIKKQTIKVLVIPLLFLVFMCLSLFWAPNMRNGLTYIFYFFCGYTIVFSLVNFASDLFRIDCIFNTLAIFFALNFFVGLLETTGYFRLPVSPYYGLAYTRPSGFNSNLNNFGFVFMAVFPFLFLYPRRFIGVIGTLMALWFTVKLQSKGFFLSLVVFFCLYFIFKIKEKNTWRWVLFGFAGSLFFSVFLAVTSAQINLSNRAFSAFGQIERAASIINDGDIVAKDSTTTRAAMYMMGVHELVKSNGMGVGVAGIGSKLASETNLFRNDKDFLSFHNFFLEMLIDMGVIPFSIVMLAYMKLALLNIQASKLSNNIKIAFYNKASGFSLLTIIPASISPASIIYEFTFWIVIGFSISIYLVTRCQLQYEN